jgi:predicted  nucleic acid-binding Zn-ribbon protein
VIKENLNNRITKLQNDLRHITKDNFELEKTLGSTMRINNEKTIELLNTNLEAQKLLIQSQNKSFRTQQESLREEIRELSKKFENLSIKVNRKNNLPTA